jgi:integrase
VIGSIGGHPISVAGVNSSTVSVRVGNVRSKRFSLPAGSTLITAEGGKALSAEHRLRLIADFARPGPNDTHFTRVRLRALVYLVWTAALRPNECLALDVAQLLEDPTARRTRIAHTCVLAPAQRRDGLRSERAYPHEFTVPKLTRLALSIYIQQAVVRGWMTSGEWRVPLFIGTQGRRGVAEHQRVSLRSIDTCWRHRLRALDIPYYSFHDLRHDAIVTFAGTPEEKARFGRISATKAETLYVNEDPTGMRHIIAAAEDFIRSTARYLGVSDDDDSLRDLFTRQHA